MKNLKKSVLCMLMAVIMVMTVTAASVIPVQDVYAASVKLNKTSLNLYTRTMVRLTVLNTGAKTKWSSSKPKVASVTSEGYVTARSAGKAKITAVIGKKKLYCNVTVKVKPGEEVKMEFKDCKVQVGKTTRLRLMNIVGLASWKSSNTKIATVDANGEKDRFCGNHCYISLQKIYCKSDCYIRYNVWNVSHQKESTFG